MASNQKKDPFIKMDDTLSEREKRGGSAALDDSGDTDYSVMIKQMIESGSNPYSVKLALDRRTNKALSGAATEQYAYDDVYSAAMDYINQGKSTGASAPSGYASPYSGKIDSILNQILNRDNFSYDHESDPLYQQYKESYTRDGEKAMQDTLGQVSMRTGGLASSYAENAAQQTYNGYMAGLNDKIPELYQAAYDKYMGDIDAKVRDLGLLNEMDASQYGKYRDTMSDWRSDRDFAYGKSRDDLGDQRYKDETAYGREQEQYSKDRETALALANAGSFGALGQLWGLDGSQTQALIDDYARQKNLTDGEAARGLADWYAQYGDFSKLKEQGVNVNLSSAGGGSKGGGSTGGGSGGSSAGQDIDGLYASAWASANPKNYIASNYKKYGFTSATGLADGYNEWKTSKAENGQKLYDKGTFDTLLAYTKKCIEKAGRSPEYMYDALKQQGYTDTIIDQVFSTLGL